MPSGTLRMSLPAFAGKFSLRCFVPTQFASIPRRSISLLVMTVLLVLAGLLLPSTARAQVTFNGAWTPQSSFGIADAGGVAVDASGNLYVTDQRNGFVEEILAVNGVIPLSPYIRVLAGGFVYPIGVAVDGSGNVYVADAGNNVVFEILAFSGVIPASPTVRVLGSGFYYPKGVAVDSSGNVWVADTGNRRVKEIVAVGGQIPATNPTINSIYSDYFAYPFGVALDASGDVYVADYYIGLLEIEAVDGVIPASPNIRLLLPETQTSGSTGVAVDGSGNVYVANNIVGSVQEIMAVGGIIPASPTINTLINGYFQYCSPGVAVNAHGDVFFMCGGSMVEMQPGPADLGTQAIGLTSAALMLNFTISNETVGSVAVLTGGAPNLDFASASGTTCVAGTYASAITCQVYVTFTPAFSGLREGAVVFYSGANNTGTVLASVPISGVGTGPQIAYGPGTATAIDPSVSGQALNSPASVAVDDAGDLFIADSSNNRVVEAPAGGGAAIAIAPTVGGIGLSGPEGVAVDGAGDLFIADLGNSRVVEVPTGGGAAIAIAPTVNGAGLVYPYGVAMDGAGDLFIADGANSRVVEVFAGGGAIAIDPTVNGYGLVYPYDMAVDGAGDLFIADPPAGQVVEIPAVGGAPTAITPSLNGNPVYPDWLAVDGAGDLFIADTNDNFVVEVPAGGSATIDLTPAVNGLSMNGPSGLTLDRAGDLFIADQYNNRVVEIERSQVPALNFPTATNVGSTDATDGTQTVEIQNIGNQPLVFTALSYPANFPEAGGDLNPCTGSTSLNAGQECDLPIEFTPLHPGSPLSESVSLTDNVTPATQQIALSGTGIAIPASLFKITANASVAAGTPFTITVTAKDAYGNTVSAYSGTVSFTSSASLFVNPGPLTLSNGIGQTTVTLATAGSQSITATDTSNSSISGKGIFTVNPLPAANLQMAVPASATSNTPFQFTVTAYDIYGNQATGYDGLVKFTSSDPGATLPAATTLSVGTGTFSGTLLTPGSQTITAKDSADSLGIVSSGIIVSPKSLVVTTSQDDAAGMTTNCPVGGPSSGSGGNCSLRDALAAATPGVSNITFSTTEFTSAQTITLGTGGALSIPSNTAVSGPTTGSGASLTNLITVSGANAYTVFTVNTGVTGAALSGLKIANGSSSDFGGGIENNGVLSVTDSTISGNKTQGIGGGIYNAGKLTLTDSTLSGNQAEDGGGGIYNQLEATLTLANSTISGNSAGELGGGVYSDGTFTAIGSTVSGNTAAVLTGGVLFGNGTSSLASTIVSGNAAQLDADILGNYADNGGNIVGGSANLAPLANYGGPTQTMLPLPGSAAICAGENSNIATGATTDQRGDPLQPVGGYCPSGTVDAGAVQTGYLLAFSTQPPETVSGAANFSAGVTLTESGNPMGGVTIPLTLNGGGTLSGGSATTGSNGVATYPALQVIGPGTGDTLTANLALNPAIATTPPVIAATSSAFEVNLASTATIAASASATFSAGAQSVTLTATVTSASGPVNTGAVTFTVLNGTTVIGSAVTSSTVANGAASVNYMLPAGTAAGTYTIQDAYNASEFFNASSDSTHTLTISGLVPPITWTVPAAITYGKALSATQLDARSTVAGTFVYSPASGTVLGAGTQTLSATFTPTNTAEYAITTVTVPLVVRPARLTVTARNLSMTYGAAVPALTYSVSGFVNGDTAATAFTGAPVLGTGISSAPPAGTYPITVTIGTLFAANYSFAFYSGTLTVKPAPLTVAAADPSMIYGSAVPSLTYSITGFVNGDTQLSAISGAPALSTTATSSSTVATYPITVAIGSLTAANYSFTLRNGTLRVVKATPDIDWATPAPIPYGTALSAAQLDAMSTVSGTFVYSPGSGILATGTHTLSTTFTPTDTADYNTARASVSLTVNQAAQTITLTPPSSPVVYGVSPIKLVATSTSGLAVTFSVQSGPGKLSGSTLTITGAGTVVVAANQAGNSDYSAAPTVTQSIVVNQATPSISLRSSANNVNPGKAVTFTATLVGGGGLKPTGTVTFLDGATAIGAGAVNSSGVATFTTSSLSAGSHSITASYTGDSNYAPVTSAPFTEIVN